MSSDNEETDEESNRAQLIPCSPSPDKQYTTTDESSTDETEMNDSSENEEEDESNSMITDLVKYDELLKEEINRKSQQVSRHIVIIHEQFQEFCDILTSQDAILAQLFRQHSYCSELLSTFDDFLVSFEEKTESIIYCGNWFAQMLLLRDRFNRFDGNGQAMIRSLNGKMEQLFDEFVEHKRQLVADQSISNLHNIANEFRWINNRISSAELQLDDIVDYIAVQMQEQRNLIGTFIEIMSAICRNVESTMVCNNVMEFDCFSGQHFLQEFDNALSAIQII